MNYFPTRIPKKSLRTVAERVVPALGDAPRGSKLVLEVRIDCNNIVARDFAAFLDLADHVYGRVSSRGLDSYSRRSGGHFAFDRSEPGSWVLIAEHALGAANAASPLLAVWLVLKYAPSGMHLLAASFNEIEQGRLARAKRKQLSEQMKRDVSLSSLSNKDRAEAARLVVTFTEQDRDLMPRASRFMRQNLQEVKLHVRNDDERNS